MGTDKPTLTQAERARELLAAEYEAGNWIFEARNVLSADEDALSVSDRTALRAIEAALQPPALPEEVGEVVEQLFSHLHDCAARHHMGDCDCWSERLSAARQFIETTLADTLTALSTRRAEGIETAAHPVFAFLLGEGPLEGSWFGDTRPAGERGNFWWRKHLRRALNQEAG